MNQDEQVDHEIAAGQAYLARHCRQCGDELEPDNETRFCSDACERDRDEDLRDRAINRRIDAFRGK